MPLIFTVKLKFTDVLQKKLTYNFMRSISKGWTFNFSLKATRKEKKLKYISQSSKIIPRKQLLEPNKKPAKYIILIVFNSSLPRLLVFRIKCKLGIFIFQIERTVYNYLSFLFSCLCNILLYMRIKGIKYSNPFLLFLSLCKWRL